MRILEVSKLYSPWLGGVEKVAQQIAQGLNKKDNFEIEVLCCLHKKGKRKIEEVNGVKVRRAKSFGIFWGMPVSFDFFGLFKKLRNNYDVVDFHHPFPLGDLAILFFTPKRLVVHYHSDIVRQKILKFLFAPLVKHTLRRAEKIVVSNPNLIKTSPYLKKFKEKCVVIPFGIDPDKIKKTLDEKKQRQIKQKYGDFVLFAGRLNYYKGVKYLIEAMKGIDANLVIIGAGAERQKLKHRTKNQQLRTKVFFLDHQKKEDLVNFYAAAKILVLPSIYRTEAFGIVLLEAMAVGTPVVSTKLGTGTSWVNKNKKTGFVVKPRDSKALCKAIHKILKDPQLAETFSKNASKRVNKLFTQKKMLSKTAAVFRDLKT